MAWVGDDLFIMRDRAKLLQTATTSAEAMKIAQAMTANGMLQG